VTFDSTGKANATLTISAGSFALLRNRDLINSGSPIWFPVLGIALFATGLSSRLRDNRTRLRILAFNALLALLFLPACSGTSTPKSTSYAIMITGASGQTSHSTTLNLTVQ
jgi:hypothetical protein